MEMSYVAVALLSAVLHAGWNAAVKVSAKPTEMMTAQMFAGAVLVIPGLIWTGLPAPAAWPWIAASTGMSMVTISAMLRAYELAGFGIVFPVMRAVSVLLIVPMAAFVAGDQLGTGQLTGVALIAVSLGVLALGTGRDQSFSRQALTWTLIAGLGTAIYILCDAQGVRQAGSPLAYGFTVAMTNAAAMCWRQRRSGSPVRLVMRHWMMALPVAAASMISYLLILWVYTKAPIAVGAAIRDTSAVFAILIAVIWLKEPLTRTRLAAVLMATAAVPLLRLT
jgi:drug/metabolite transporter (DMT)-like permease